MQTIKIRLIGTKPMLQHSDCLADPLNPKTKAHKELTSKRKKTDDDHEAIAKSEWLASLYFNEETGPYIPGQNIYASMVSGAKLSKLGKQIQRGCEVVEDECPLEYEGPRDIKGLWNERFYDARSVKVQAARLIRYRPIFKKWATTCTIAFDEQAIDSAQIIKCLQDAGAYCGIGDYRPRFGRFEVEVLQ